MKQKPKRDPYRKTGMITWQGQPVSLLVNRKTGLLKFQKNGRDVTDDAEIDAIYAYLKDANQEH